MPCLRRLFAILLLCWLPLQAHVAAAMSVQMPAMEHTQSATAAHAHAACSHGNVEQARSGDDASHGMCMDCGLCQLTAAGWIDGPIAQQLKIVGSAPFPALAAQPFASRYGAPLLRPPSI